MGKSPKYIWHPAFGPEEIETLSRAFERSWDELKASGKMYIHAGRDDLARKALARTILEQAEAGERDIQRLCAAAIAAMTGERSSVRR